LGKTEIEGEKAKFRKQRTGVRTSERERGRGSKIEEAENGGEDE
jgi:hypothetical protein